MPQVSVEDTRGQPKRPRYRNTNDRDKTDVFAKRVARGTSPVDLLDLMALVYKDSGIFLALDVLVVALSFVIYSMHPTQHPRSKPG